MWKFVIAQSWEQCVQKKSEEKDALCLAMSSILQKAVPLCNTPCTFSLLYLFICTSTSAFVDT